jgi:putative toxin-antitoxin system antitoxin component (TIGR02293 family)
MESALAWCFTRANWRAILGHMATSAAKALSAATADLVAFQEHIGSGRSQGHYYAALLGLRTYDALRIYASVRKGLSYSAFEHLQRNTSIPALVFAELTGIPRRTLTRRKEQGKLEPQESDRLLRFARVFGRALELFEGNVDAARAWLTARHPALGGLSPLDLAKTDVGANEVENLIGRLEFGIPA